MEKHAPVNIRKEGSQYPPSKPWDIGRRLMVIFLGEGVFFGRRSVKELASMPWNFRTGIGATNTQGTAEFYAKNTEQR